jgi:hypothetical protein
MFFIYEVELIYFSSRKLHIKERNMDGRLPKFQAFMDYLYAC